ncbi:hypothetical protein CSIRO_4024 [Bradyrhizobiaceae bacterium SG-6C]|nr:hypothetical protein CSIRO_4024 [Bradyrhizobiaceae bacterium SG-6C]
MRSGAPGTLRTGAPGASALILPRHRQSPPREAGAPQTAGNSSNASKLLGPYRGRARSLQRRVLCLESYGAG